MASSNVEIQTSPQSVPSIPSWMGELTIVAHYLTHLGLLEQIAERVRFARARFGIYDTIDFVVVLIGYALSGEPTLKAFYERLLPFALPFMALFGRNKLPSRSALSRFLEAIDQPTVEALRTRFEEDLRSATDRARRAQRRMLHDCRGCRLREHCLGYGNQTKGPRRVSAVLRPVEGPSPPRDATLPLAAPTEPVLWGDWSRSATRRAFIGLLHTQTVTMTMTPASSGSQDASGPVVLTRKQRAHWRLSWAERLSRNASSPLSPTVHLQLFGIPTAFALLLGLPAAA